MKLNIDKYIKTINVDKAKRITCLTFKNFRPDLNIDFLPGAIEINSYQSSNKYFLDIKEFYVMIRLMPYINHTEIEIPMHLLNSELCFEPVSQDRFQHYIKGYLESFQDLSDDAFWRCKIDTEGFINGYKLVTKGSELVLIGEFEKYYFSFIYQSID